MFFSDNEYLVLILTYAFKFTGHSKNILKFTFNVLQLLMSKKTDVRFVSSITLEGLKFMFT